MGKKRIYDHKTPGDSAQRKLSILGYKLLTGYDTSFLLGRNVLNTNRIRMGVADNTQARWTPCLVSELKVGSQRSR